MNRFKNAAVVALVIACNAAASAADFADRFAKVHVGMHRAEITELLGSADERVASNTLGVERLEFIYRREGGEFRITLLASLVVSKTSRVPKGGAVGTFIDNLFRN